MTKKLFLLLLAGACLHPAARAQRGEFPVYENGLIYSEQAMSRLGQVVDSLNLKFKTCDLNPRYYATSQTVAHKVTVKDADISAARADIQKSISWEAFLKKYPDAVVKQEVLMIRELNTNYKGNKEVIFTELNLRIGTYNRVWSADMGLLKQGMAGQWLMDYTPRSSYAEKALTAYYFPRPFETPALPEKYARMVGYAECMIDTSETTMRETAHEGRAWLPANWTQFSMAQKEVLLDSLRNTRVMGFCSMDDSPRLHAMQIALVSAETYNWKVFLRAHLDIMNDRFDRVSDGTYAWERRETYIRELEVLDIQVLDLLLGTCFRIENGARNHYLSQVGRLGRALTEAADRADMEATIEAAISDTKLDDFNRLVMYFVFENYLGYLKTEADQQAAAEKLKQCAQTLPAYMQAELLEAQEED